MYEGIKTIAEVVADWKVTNSQSAQINTYLKHGWVILAIHQRGFNYVSDGESVSLSVYIFGHTSDTPVKPSRDTMSGVWS